MILLPQFTHGEAEAQRKPTHGSRRGTSMSIVSTRRSGCRARALHPRVCLCHNQCLVRAEFGCRSDTTFPSTLGILSKCRFWSHRSRIWPEVLHFLKKLSDDVDADCPPAPLWVTNFCTTATFYCALTAKILLCISACSDPCPRPHTAWPYLLLKVPCSQLWPIRCLHRWGQWPFTEL